MALSFSWNSYFKMEYFFNCSFPCLHFLRNFLLKNRNYKRAYFQMIGTLFGCVYGRQTWI
jgi:hypothetical protein